MTTRNGSSDSGVSRRDMMRLGAGGLGFGLLGGLGPVPYVLNQASLAAATNQSGGFSWSSNGSAATTA